MITAIIMGFVLGICTLFFAFFVYVVLSIIFSLFENVGKDKFTWYGISLYSSSGKLAPYDSFKDMIMSGVKINVRVAGLIIAMCVIVCIYVELRG